MQPNRSWLFAPGNHARKVEKVFATGADVAILDLEDAVAVAEKAATREVVAKALALPHACRAYVRVNALDTGFTFGDLARRAVGTAFKIYVAQTMETTLCNL